MNKNDRFLQKWKEKRQLGKKTYVLRYGLIGFGVITTVLLTLFEFITNQTIDPNYFILRIVVIPTIGIIGASYRWEACEGKYAKFHPPLSEP